MVGAAEYLLKDRATDMPEDVRQTGFDNPRFNADQTSTRVHLNPKKWFASISHNRKHGRHSQLSCLMFNKLRSYEDERYGSRVLKLAPGRVLT
jgi:hypothetical protein